MPTYDYRCDDCGSEKEVFQKMTDNPLSECPECGGAFKRLIGTGGTPIFKGSGFYETDYKSKGKSSKEKTKKTDTKKSA